MRILSTVLLLSFLFVEFTLLAQPGGGGPGGGEDPDAPIQGLGFLLVAGLILGVRKILNKKK